MKAYQRLQLVALGMFAILFLWSGIAEKLLGWNDTVRYIASQGLPWPSFLALGGLLVELILPVALLVPRTRGVAALALAIYTLVTALLFHNFWAGDDATHTQLQNFLKNVALSGGLLFVFADAVERSRWNRGARTARWERGMPADALR